MIKLRIKILNKLEKWATARKVRRWEKRIVNKYNNMLADAYDPEATIPGVRPKLDTQTELNAQIHRIHKNRP